MSDQTILLIDYDPDSIERARKPLIEAGYRVEVAKDGRSGLAAFEKIRPALVLVEAMLPKKHGFEVCQEIKQSESGKETPVVIATAAFRGRRYRTDALRIYGCDEYLEKPLDVAELVAICRRLAGEPSKTQQSPVAEPQPVAASGASTMGVMTEEELDARLTAVLRDGQGGAGPRASTPTATRTRPAPTSTGSGAGLPPSLDDLSDGEVDARLDALLLEDFDTEIEAAPADESPQIEVEVPLPAKPNAVEDLVADDELSAASELLTEEPDESPVSFDESENPPVASAEPEPDAKPEPDAVPDEVLKSHAPDEEALRAAVAQDELARKLADTEDDEKAHELQTKGEERQPQPVLPPIDRSVRPSVVPGPPTKPAEQVAAVLDGIVGKSPATTSWTEPSLDSGTSGKERSSKMPWMIGVAALVVVGVAAGLYFVMGNGGGAPETVASVSRQTPRPVVSAPRTAAPQTAPAGSIVPTTGVEAVEPTTIQPEKPATVLPAETEAATPPVTTAARPKPAPAKPAPRRSAPPPPVTASTQPKVDPEPVEPVPLKTETETTASPPPVVTETAPAETNPPAAPPVSGEVQASAEPSIVVDDAGPFLTDDGGSTSFDPQPLPEPRKTEPAPVIPQRPSPPPAPKTQRGELVELAGVDTRPVPLSRPAPEYDSVARRFGQHGTVSMKALIDENGNVVRVEVVEGIPRSRLNASAMKAVQTWTYKPATKDGVPVKVWQPVSVKFEQ